LDRLSICLIKEKILAIYKLIDQLKVEIKVELIIEAQQIVKLLETGGIIDRFLNFENIIILFMSIALDYSVFFLART
jgi:hypothetical protein